MKSRLSLTLVVVHQRAAGEKRLKLNSSRSPSSFTDRPSFFPRKGKEKRSSPESTKTAIGPKSSGPEREGEGVLKGTYRPAALSLGEEAYE